VPTFAEYVPVVAATLTGSTLRAYSSYWKRTIAQWGGRRLDEPTPSEVKQLAVYVKANAVQRRNSRGGHNAEENLISALRCLYRHAVDDGLIDEKDNPASKVPKPRRLPSTRRALDDARLAEINQVAATTGDAPELDTLILRLHTETACRRGGALALRPRDLDVAQCLVLLREKGETFRWQPVSPTLMAALVQHAEERHAPPSERLLRYQNGRKITDRRYDHLWVRLGRELPWVRTQGISTHWLRHAAGLGLAAVVVATVLAVALPSPALPVLIAGAAVAGFRLLAGKTETRKVAGVVGVPTLAGLFGAAVVLGALSRLWAGPPCCSPT
jgi:integrase/recombinase XerC